jgi:glycosyltransferase involved in cell wall biosynthesis
MTDHHHPQQSSARPSEPDGRRSVSVIMPVGSVDEDLRLQLEALEGQSYDGPWELVLSLNSTDGPQGRRLRELAERWSESGSGRYSATVVDSSSMRSASHARNVGAAHAGGELLLFCDGDDIADADWMSSLVDALSDARAVGGHLEEEVLAVPGQEGWRPPATPGALPSFLGFPYLVSANMGIHRADFEAVDGFDTTLIRGEDIAFSWDLIERGVELIYSPEAIIHYRHRRGLWPMMKQHYLYGRGFSQILARRGVPGSSEGTTGLKALRPNGQAADKNLAYFARRGSIAAGRVVGLVTER